MATYCEWLFMDEPREIEMPLNDAIKRFELKKAALDSHKGLAVDMSFIAVKDDDGKIILTT